MVATNKAASANHPRHLTSLQIKTGTCQCHYKDSLDSEVEEWVFRCEACLQEESPCEEGELVSATGTGP